MASRIVGKAIMAAAKDVAARVRRGKPLPTFAGTLLGAAAGATCGFVMIELVVPGIALGAIAGAALAASLFQRAPRALAAKQRGNEGTFPGTVRRYWSSQVEKNQYLTVLLDRAIYLVDYHTGPWDDVLANLANGVDPDLPYAKLIHLDAICSMEIQRSDPNLIGLVYDVGSGTRRRDVLFRSLQDREEFIGALERCFGRPFNRDERSMSLSRAILVPLVLLILLGAFVGGFAAIADYEAENPPWKQSAGAKFFVSLGPGNILLIGAIPLLGILGWLVFRIFRPPRIQVLTRPRTINQG